MITANELRIGNAVWFECDNLHMTTQGTVTYIKEDGKYIGGKDVGKPILMVGLIDQWGANREEHIIDLEGIPLTPEILEQWCGFEKKNDLEDYKLGFITVKFRRYSITASNNHGYLCDIQYLHQLQNLIFALTGEELQIKL